MTDWLAVCRGAVEDVHGVLEELPTRAEREPVVGEGEGGDDTTAVDAAAERVILARLQEVGGTTIVSEEVGIVGDGSTLIVVDPIDGSLNAKRGIPFFSVSIAVAEGDTMDDVVFAFVHDFGSGEEWVAEQGMGARLNGAVLAPLPPKEEIEILSFEATLTSSIAEKAGEMVGLAYRLRVMGSLALSLCHLGAGRVDAVCSLKPARAVDIAAAQSRGQPLELAARRVDRAGQRLRIRERQLERELAPPSGDPRGVQETGARELAKLVEGGVTEAELERAKNAMIGHFAIGRQTNAAEAGLAARYELLGLGHEEIERYEERVLAVTRDEVRPAAERWLAIDRLTIAVVRPRAAGR